MKTLKFYLILLFLVGSVCLYADGPTATLQHSGELSVYFGQDAFQKAYSDAEAGDTITLSPGTFTYLSSDLEKSLTITGTYGMHPDSVNRTYISQISVKADDVKIEGICIQYLYFRTISNCIVKRCRLNYIATNNTNEKHTNTLIDQCAIFGYDNAIQTGINYAIKNSTIMRFAAVNSTTQLANITNCWVWNFYEYANSNTKQPYAVYKNNVLGLNTSTANFSSNSSAYLYAPSEYYNNCFYLIANGKKTYRYLPYFNGCLNTGNVSFPEEGTAVFSNLSDNAYFPWRDDLDLKGADNTPIGITGGTGFNEYPAIPRVIKATIDAQNDGDGYLNANIKVKSER